MRHHGGDELTIFVRIPSLELEKRFDYFRGISATLEDMSKSPYNKEEQGVGCIFMMYYVFRKQQNNIGNRTALV